MIPVLRHLHAPKGTERLARPGGFHGPIDRRCVHGDHPTPDRPIDRTREVNIEGETCSDRAAAISTTPCNDHM